MSEQPWMNAAREAIYYAEALAKATTIGAQGQALTNLNDAVSDLSSFLPEYDFEVGVDSITRPMED